MSRNINIGNKGENIAKEFLIEKGYNIIAQNWRHKHWEIDIICNLGKKLHFVEVKTRTSLAFGHPEESVTQAKFDILKKAAEEYLYQNQEWTLIQFDVIAITLNKETVEEIFLIEDVFF